MAIVKDYMDGPTHIIIDDKYVVKTKEENDAIIQRCMELAIASLIARQNKKAPSSGETPKTEQKQMQGDYNT